MSSCGMFANCVRPGSAVFGQDIDLGARIYHDEFGSSYIYTQPDWSWENEDRFYYNVTPSGNPDEVILYVPSNPPVDQAEYDSWPANIKSIIPFQWSGDYTRGGWASAFSGNETQFHDPSDVVSFPMYYVGLRQCGWGRWVGLKSYITGERGRCEFKTSADVGAVVGMMFKAIARAVSFIPGVGTIMGPILGGIGAIASGENISAVMLEAASNAVPGGGVATAAAKTAIKTAQSLAEGKDVGTAILDGTRKALEQAGAPVEVLDGFDVCVALGTGKGLQDAGFRVLGRYIQSSNVYESGTKFLDSVSKAKAIGVSPEKFLTVALSKDVYRAAGPVAAEKLAPLLEEVPFKPNLRNMPSEELAIMYGVTEPIARAAQVIGQYGYVNQKVKEEILKTIQQRIWEKWGMQAFEEGPLNLKYKEALLKKHDETLKLGMTLEGNRFTDYYYQEYPQMSMTAGRVASGGLGSPLNPGTDAGIRVQLDGIGADAIAKGPASFAYKKAKLANDVQRRTFNIGIGALVQGKWTPEQMDYWMRGLGSDQFIGWTAAKKIWGDNLLVGGKERVALQEAGAAISAADPIYAAARKTVPGANGQRGFDIAMGQLLGHTGYDVELESVRNTIDHDPELRSGFDTAVAVVRGRQNAQVPAGMTAGQAAGFLTTEGLKGNPSGAIKTSVMGNVASDAQAREGAKAQMSFFDKVLDFLGLL